MSPYRESTEEQGSIQRGQDALSCRTREGEPARQGRRLGSKSKERERGGASGVRDGVAQDCLRPDIRLETRDFLQGFLQIRFENRRSEEHTSELQSPMYLVCRLLLEKKKKKYTRE